MAPARRFHHEFLVGVSDLTDFGHVLHGHAGRQGPFQQALMIKTGMKAPDFIIDHAAEERVTTNLAALFVLRQGVSRKRKGALQHFGFPGQFLIMLWVRCRREQAGRRAGALDFLRVNQSVNVGTCLDAFFVNGTSRGRPIPSGERSQG